MWLDAGDYWGYDDIAKYLNVSVDSARHFAGNPKFPERVHPKARLWRADEVVEWHAERKLRRE